MKVEVKVPVLSESVSEATLLKWHYAVGQKVERDANLVDVETDKVVLELPAPVAGVLVNIAKGDGYLVKAEEVVALIDTEAKATEATAATVAAATSINKAKSNAKTAEITSSDSKSEKAATAEKLSPAARKLAAELGVSPTEIAGQGRGGRVTKADLLQFKAQNETATSAPAASSAASSASTPAANAFSHPRMVDDEEIERGRSSQRVPMTRLRARIAERLLQSQSQNAILTTFNEVNMAAVIDLRNRYKDAFEKRYGVRLGFMSFFVKATIQALKRYPILNASVDGKDIIYHGYYDIGIAVGSERGLVVPIVRDADQMTVFEIEKAIADFGQKAKDGKLTIEDLSGGTFSISNGGVFGSMLSTPIINPPQSAILGIHATKDRPVAENGQVVIRPMNYLAMSYDHRLIDGKEAVLGLVAIKEALEDPNRLLLDV